MIKYRISTIVKFAWPITEAHKKELLKSVTCYKFKIEEIKK